MRALILEQPGVVRLHSIPTPEPGPGEVLVRVRAATTCGTDLKAYLRGHPQIPMPGPFGHEYSGDVAAVGYGGPFRTGLAVMGVHSAPCQTCRWCTGGQENLCETIMATKVLGSFAEYLLVPARVAQLNLFEKPPAMPYEIAALLEPLSCVAQGVSLLPLERVRSALVIGPGAIGLMFVAALKLLGIPDVALLGRDPARLAIGEKLGARMVNAERPEELRGFDAVIECTGQVAVWEESVAYVRRGGVVMLFGGPPGGTRACFDTHRLHYDQITLISPFHFGTEAVQTARGWLADPRMDLSALISGERSLQEGPEVFEDLNARRGVKYVFVP